MTRQIDVSDLQNIRKLLADALGAVDQTIARSYDVAGAEQAVVVGRAVWRKPDVAGLVARVQHLPAARALLTLCASHSGAWVNYEQVRDAVGRVNPRQTQNELSAMTRHVNKLRGSTDWPIEVEAAPTLRYRADVRMAKWIHEALVAVTP